MVVTTAILMERGSAAWLGRDAGIHGQMPMGVLSAVSEFFGMSP
jgi:hypothetical protein